MSPATLRAVMKDVASHWNPVSYPGEGRYELRSLSAPVFNGVGQVAFALTLWGPPGDVDQAIVQEHVLRLKAAAAAATDAIGGVASDLTDKHLA